MEEKKLDEPVVEDAQPEFSRSRSTRHSSRSHSDRSSSALQKGNRRLALTVSLAVSLLVLALVITFSAVRISSLIDENEELQARLTQTRQELSQTGPELERIRKVASEMAKGRLPHLRELVTDKVLQINGPYIKNIVFTVLNQNGTKNYEYKLVMENSTERTVHPEARIFVFDRYGVQIGSSEVPGRTDLSPGESRSQSSVIDRFINEEPRFFYVSAMRADKPTGPNQ